MFLSDITLPEFANGQHIQGVAARLFDSLTCPHDIIFERKFINAIGLKIDFENNCIQWMDTIIDMKNIQMYNHLRNNNNNVVDIGLQPTQ